MYCSCDLDLASDDTLAIGFPIASTQLKATPFELPTALRLLYMATRLV